MQVFLQLFLNYFSLKRIEAIVRVEIIVEIVI